jgi:hypothetical protein
MDEQNTENINAPSMKRVTCFLSTTLRRFLLVLQTISSTLAGRAKLFTEVIAVISEFRKIEGTRLH